MFLFSGLLLISSFIVLLLKVCYLYSFYFLELIEFFLPLKERMLMFHRHVESRYILFFHDVRVEYTVITCYIINYVL